MQSDKARRKMKEVAMVGPKQIKVVPDYAMPQTLGFPSSIVRPVIEAPNSFSTWDSLLRAFLRKCFSRRKTTKLRADITSFA